MYTYIRIWYIYLINNLNRMDELIVTKEYRNNNLDDILETELTVYSYTTDDGLPGTIIINSMVNPKLETLFDDDKLFVMDNVKTRKITLKSILESGVVSVGSTDLMETINISYPDQRICTKKPTITGLYMHGSRRRLIAEPLDTEFNYDPESDHENVEFDDDDNDNENIPGTTNMNNDMSWLCNGDK